jgi:hypothetical protein
MFLGGGCIGCFDLFALHLFWLLVIFCSCNPYLVFFLWVFFIVLIGSLEDLASYILVLTRGEQKNRKTD